MNIAIDSAKNLSFTGVMSGSQRDIDNFYDELKNIFSKNNIHPPFHWRKLTTKTRIAIRPEIERLVNSDNHKIKFNVFMHKKPFGIPQKQIIFEKLPQAIAENLDAWLQKVKGTIIFEFDDDFRDNKRTTHDFIKKTFKNIIPTLTNEMIPIRFEGKSHKSQ